MHSVRKIWIVQQRTYGYDRSIETRIRCQFFEPYFAPKLWHLDACNTEVPHQASTFPKTSAVVAAVALWEDWWVLWFGRDVNSLEKSWQLNIWGNAHIYCFSSIINIVGDDWLRWLIWMIGWDDSYFWDGIVTTQIFVNCFKCQGDLNYICFRPTSCAEDPDLTTGRYPYDWQITVFYSCHGPVLPCHVQDTMFRIPNQTFMQLKPRNTSDKYGYRWGCHSIDWFFIT